VRKAAVAGHESVVAVASLGCLSRGTKGDSGKKTATEVGWHGNNGRWPE